MKPKESTFFRIRAPPPVTAIVLPPARMAPAPMVNEPPVIDRVSPWAMLKRPMVSFAEAVTV